MGLVQSMALVVTLGALLLLWLAGNDDDWPGDYLG